MRRMVPVVALLLLAPGSAWAAGEGESPAALIWHAVNLAILIAVIVYFARRPLLDFFAKRRRGATTAPAPKTES